MKYAKIIESIKENPGDMLSLSGFFIYLSLIFLPLSDSLGGWYWYFILPFFMLSGLTIGIFAGTLAIQHKNELWEKELSRRAKSRRM